MDMTDAAARMAYAHGRAAQALEDRARIAALEAALQALVAEEPDAIDGRARYCVYCEGVDGGLSHTTIVHKDDCPWLAAKRLMGG